MNKDEFWKTLREPDRKDCDNCKHGTLKMYFTENGSHSATLVKLADGSDITYTCKLASSLGCNLHGGKMKIWEWDEKNY